MQNTVFVKDQIDYRKEPLFFGSGMNIQRFDSPKYPIFEKLAKQMLGYFWTPEEVGLSKDRSDYQRIPEEQKRIFTSNLSYQILLDSVQGRSVALAFMPFVSNPELEQCLNIWETFELIHSRSYSYIIKNLYAHPDEIFNNVVTNEYIQSRAESVTTAYDSFINTGVEYRHALLSDPSLPAPYELKRKLYIALIGVYILEAIRFYVSFACTFAFAENKLMEGSAKIVKLIARDENIHVALVQNMLKLFRSGAEGEEWAQIAEECTEEAEAMFAEGIEEEKRWARYLFRDGSMIGLNEKVLDSYLEHLGAKRCRAIGLKSPYKRTVNPLGWMSTWVGGARAVQNAPQETVVDNYVVGNTNNNIDYSKFSDFKL